MSKIKVALLLITALSFTACNKDKLPEGVEYDVVFSGSWTSTDHPLDYPDNAHFSTAVGMSHEPGVHFWELGTVASDGMEEMAETGKTDILESEIQPLVDATSALQFIRGEGLDTGTSSETFTIVVDTDHPLVSIVSMIAPSPDWFVGVESLSLRQNDQWVDQLTVPLENYDAGTDSGLTFKTDNEDTQPRENIFRITEEPLDYQLPLATLTFIRKN